MSYYDYRFNEVNSNDGLETAHWIRRSSDGGAAFGPDEMLGTTFDTRGPCAIGFLGDYDGLASIGDSFSPFWISTEGSTAPKPVLNGSVDTADRTASRLRSVTPTRREIQWTIRASTSWR